MFVFLWVIMFPFTNSVDISWSKSLIYPTYEVSVKDFGAIGNGITMDTKAIQDAIKYVSQYINPKTSVHGGIVRFPSGHYLTGAIQLLSNSYFYLDKKATIYAATNYTIYAVLISSNNAHNIGIFGEGNINGQNHKYIDYYNYNENKLIPMDGTSRPRLIQFKSSTNITLRGPFSLLNSPFWTSHYLNCRNVIVDGIHVYTDISWPNGDGINPENTQNMIISNVNIHTGDDGICFKSTDTTNPTSNIFVENAVITSHGSAIKFGSDTKGVMYDIHIVNVTVVDSNRGLAIQMRDNGSVYNVLYENINIETRWYDNDVNAWWGDAEPIWITAIQRTQTQKDVGNIWNITFRNMSIRSENGIFISGIGNPLKSVSEIYLENIDMIVDEWDKLYTHPSIDYRPSYANYSKCINTSVNGIRLEDVKDVYITNMNLTFVDMDRQTFWKQCIGEHGQTQHIVVDNFNCLNPE